MNAVNTSFPNFLPRDAFQITLYKGSHRESKGKLQNRVAEKRLLHRK